MYTPALVTAAASFGPAATFMPERKPVSQRDERTRETDCFTCQHDGVIYPEELGERGCENGLGGRHDGRS